MWVRNQSRARSATCSSAPGFFEQMGRARHHVELVLAVQLRGCVFVEPQHRVVVATDDQQRRRDDRTEPRAREIRSSAT